jgi:hypothetical protein
LPLVPVTGLSRAQSTRQAASDPGSIRSAIKLGGCTASRRSLRLRLARVWRRLRRRGASLER